MTTAAARTPRRHETIKVRDVSLTFPDSMPTFWFDGNPFLTAVMGALAVSFPPGERFFIASVRHFLPRIEDPELRAAVRAFIGQEGNHTREHIAFNRFLDSRGYPASELEEWVRKRIAHIREVSTPEANLARTAALEHFTAVLAGSLLEHPEVLERMAPEAAKLWAWHAIEEVEHRDVAFDVYQAAVGDDELRFRVMRQVTVIFVLVNSYRTYVLMRASGSLRDVGAIAKGMNALWVKPGIFRKVIPQYLAYYRPDFHPSEHDNREHVERAKARWLGE